MVSGKVNTKMLHLLLVYDGLLVFYHIFPEVKLKARSSRITEALFLFVCFSYLILILLENSRARLQLYTQYVICVHNCFVL